jgi:hypothetical protein
VNKPPEGGFFHACALYMQAKHSWPQGRNVIKKAQKNRREAVLLFRWQRTRSKRRRARPFVRCLNVD